MGLSNFFNFFLKKDDDLINIHTMPSFKKEFAGC